MRLDKREYPFCARRSDLQGVIWYHGPARRLPRGGCRKSQLMPMMAKEDQVDAVSVVFTEARKALGAFPFTSSVVAAGSRQINEIYIVHVDRRPSLKRCCLTSRLSARNLPAVRPSERHR